MFDQQSSLPNSAQTFDEIIQLLDSRVNLEKLNDFSMQDMENRLEEMRYLLKILGSPETRYRTVHVAGTKGKGSTCAFLGSILTENHYSVGCFSSPHLYSVLERVTINGVPCSEEDFTELMGSICERLRKKEPKCFEELTYFELLTIFACEYFARKQVDVAIFEVGLGGRLDATNVCRPDVTIITSISFDHIAQLGPTLADIAAEKAGIIKPGVPLVSAVLKVEPKNVIQNIARKKIAPEFFLGTSFHVHRSDDHKEFPQMFKFQTDPKKFPTEFTIDQLTLGLSGLHQIRNASLAIATALLLSEKTSHLKLDPQKIRSGLRKAYLPIRVEIIRSANTSPVIVFDGAHNQSSVAALIKTIRREFPGKRYIVIFGISLGKDVEGMLSNLLYNFERMILTQYSLSHRRFPPQGLKTIASSLPNAPEEMKGEFFYSSAGEDTTLMFESGMMLDSGLNFEVGLSTGRCSQVDVIEDCRTALETAWESATANDVICVTGSMFLAAELRKIFFERWKNSGEKVVNSNSVSFKGRRQKD